METPDARGSFWVLLVASTIIIQGSVGVQVEVDPREILVLPGQNVTGLCRVGVPLQYCRIELPGMPGLNLNPSSKSLNKEVSYYGSGLEAGQCGFNIHRVTEQFNGQVKCTLGTLTESAESIGYMQLIVARAPKRPELDISRGTDSFRVYKIGDVLQASCVVKDGRPAANISWFLDDEPLYGEGLSMPTVVELAKENVQSKVQNLTRTLQPSDNGKTLRCVAHHPAYLSHSEQAGRQLDVKFAPLPKDDLDKFGYVIGQSGIISVLVEANPKPQIEWDLDGEHVREGGVDQSGRIEAPAARDLGRGRYQVDLRIAAILRHDTERKFVLRAYNDLGSQDYNIKISTNPEPQGVELGLGGIVGIVVSVLIIVLLVFMLVFAKVTGRWCFSDGATVIDYTTRGSDGVDNPHHQVSQEYINGNNEKKEHIDGSLNVSSQEKKIDTAV